MHISGYFFRDLFPREDRAERGQVLIVPHTDQNYLPCSEFVQPVRDGEPALIFVRAGTPSGQAKALRRAKVESLFCRIRH